MSNSNASFIGSIPENYDKYLGPLIFEEYSVDLANRFAVPDGGRVLEVAAGTGLASRHLRAVLPADVHITVTDLNEPMLEVAKKKFPGTNNLTFQTADALDLPFEDAFFDAIACQFGLMFFPDKQAGVNEAFRVLKPGGDYLFSVWDSYDYNPLIKLVNDTLVGMFPDNPPAFLDVPLGYYQIDEIRRILNIAGFGDVEIHVLPRPIKTASARNVPLGFIMGNPLSIQVPERGGDIDEVINFVTDKITQQYGAPPIVAQMQAIVFKAHKPK